MLNEAKILWNYPINSLTLVFSAPKSKPFEFCLKDLDYFTNINKVKVNGDIKVYNGESNQELQITKGGNKVCWKSGINKTFQLKLAASSQLKYYGVIIGISSVRTETLYRGLKCTLYRGTKKKKKITKL